MQCIKCRKAGLETRSAELEGEIQGETFSVNCPALVCPKCGYKTIGAGQIQTFMRLLADQFREKHGLLTSEEIKRMRSRKGWSQSELAMKTGAGSASIKRWELGKIQDAAMDRLLRLFLDPEYARRHAREMNETDRRLIWSQPHLQFSHGEDERSSYKSLAPFYYVPDSAEKC